MNKKIKNKVGLLAGSLKDFQAVSPEAVNISSAQIMVSKHHFPFKGPKLSGNVADSKSRQKKYQMSLTSITVPGSEDMLSNKSGCVNLMC